MGLDIGDKRIGIALSDADGLIASPKDTLNRKGTKKDVISLITLAQREQVDAILVGMPISLDGSYGPQAKKVERFIKALREPSNMEVIPWDERMSTIAAEEVLQHSNLSPSRRKMAIDKVAAACILQWYLDHLNQKPNSEALKS